MQPEVEKQYFSDKPLQCRSYANAYVLACRSKYLSGVVAEDFRVVEGNVTEYHGEDSSYMDCTAIYLGYFHWVWGHNLTDNIKRLWFLYTDEGRRLLAEGAHVVYTCAFNKDVSDNGRKLFAMADVNFDQFEKITGPTQFKRLYVPDDALIHDTITHEPLGERFYTNEFWQTVLRIKQKIRLPKQTFDKVYFSRTGLTSNYLRETGEWDIERVFRRKGYEIIRPEVLPLDEQLAILASCSHFATTEGSIAHNAIFCKPATQVEIVQKAVYVNHYQLAINEMADLNVTYIDGHHTTPPYGEGHVWYGPFYMCITPYLLKWAGFNMFYVPYWLQPSYWWFNLRKKSVVAKWLANRKFVHRLERNYWERCASK